MLQITLNDILPWLIVFGSIFIQWGQLLGFKANINTKILEMEQRMVKHEHEIESSKKDQVDLAKALVRIETLLENSVVENIKAIKDDLHESKKRQEQLISEIIKKDQK